jgi:hypothetical protein
MFDKGERGNYKELPLFKKGKEIFEVVNQICQLIPDDDSPLASIKQVLLEDAMMLTVKIAGASGGQLYDSKMEAATLIRKSAMNLMVQNHTLEMFGFEYTEYFQIVRNLLEEFRLLFIDWVAKFDRWDYAIDRWGLFNPPGVGPFDKDPDEDIPLDGWDDEDEV